MIGAKMTQAQLERRREALRRANDPAEIEKRRQQIAATAKEDYAAIGAALQAMAEHDGRCIGRQEETR